MEDHAEEIYVDLLKQYGFDLIAFLAGEVAATPLSVLTLIKHLPEGSLYVSKLRASAPAKQEDGDEPAEIDPVQENLTWTIDRVLMAQLINSVNMLTRYSVNWGEGGPPDIPVLGPASWRGEGPGKPASKQVTMMDVLNNISGAK